MFLCCVLQRISKVYGVLFLSGCGDSRCHPFTECDAKTLKCVCKPVVEVAAPVCGTDGLNYENSFQFQSIACFNNRNVTVAYDGFCIGKSN